MSGSKVLKRAGVWLASTAMLPALAVAQSNSAAPQTVPGLDRFNLPPSTRPTPAPIPTSGPIIAPLSRPTPTPSILVIPTPRPSPTVTPAAPATPNRRSMTAATPAPAPVSPATAVATPTPTPSIAPTPEPTASAVPKPIAPTPVAAEQSSGGLPIGLLIAIGLGLLALVAAGGYLLGRHRGVRGEDAADEYAPEPVAAPAPPRPVAPPGNVTIPARRRGADEVQPRLEITLIPRRAGTNLMSAAVDYRVIVRNTGAVAARDIRFGMYMLTASARHAQDLQMIFAAPVEQPMVPPFDLAPGADVELSGIAMLAREQINVMTIDGRPWFVPVLAMKADYRWGDNVGAPGVAAAAHMIGIDRGEGAKMAPFRLDGGPHMHPEVAERKVA